MKRLKTCFVESFDLSTYFGAVLGATVEGREAPILDIPIKEFINFIEQDNLIYYYGSETIPPCSETVTWIINLNAHVITAEQVNAIKSLFSDKISKAGGNNRGTFEYDAEERTIYKFSNIANK